MSDGSEFQVCGAASENARRANSVRVLAADSSGASEDRSGRTGTAGWIRSCKYVREPLLISGAGIYGPDAHPGTQSTVSMYIVGGSVV